MRLVVPASTSLMTHVVTAVGASTNHTQACSQLHFYLSFYYSIIHHLPTPCHSLSSIFFHITSHITHSFPAFQVYCNPRLRKPTEGRLSEKGEIQVLNSEFTQFPLSSSPPEANLLSYADLMAHVVKCSCFDSANQSKAWQ